MQPGDKIIVAFVLPQELGDEFSEWPLHVTILPWVRGDSTNQALAKSVHDAVSKMEAFTVKVGEEAMFGQGNVPVNVISEYTELLLAHDAIISALNKLGYHQVAERYPDYRPHVTLQPSARLHEGDTFVCSRIYIVEQKGDHKEVVGEVLLRHDETAA